MTLERGAFLHNRYRILEILGQGGMGAIYRAIDENLGVEVAVKENLFTTDEYARQFKREAIILANLRQSNLPRVSDHFVIDGQGQYLVMDYIEGEDLRERMDRIGVISENEILVIGAAICDALTYMHTRKPPVLHRDIKPGNVKITSQGEIFLVDFGLAKVVQAGEQTKTGARAMTPGYSPPEQYGAARTDHRSDIYSLGATMYAALVGVIPEDSLARTMEQTELTPIRKRNPKVSRRTSSAIEKALAVHPDDRFQTAEEFKQALSMERSTTVRKMVEQGILLPSSEIESQDILPSERITEQPIESDILQEAQNSHFPLPVSTTLEDIDEIPIKPKKTKRGRGCLWIFSLIIILLAAGFGLIYGVEPELPIQLISLASTQIVGKFPAEYTIVQRTPTRTSEPIKETDPVPILDPSDTPVPTEVTATEQTQIPSLSPTQTATVVFTKTPAPTSTPVPSRTPRPTSTKVLTATPMGGGYGQIAFASDRTGIPQIWVINIDGTGLRQITAARWGACQSDWSPDGVRLVYTSPCNGNKESYRGSGLFIINADGTDQVPLPVQGIGDYDPAWSPDGSKIAFTSLRANDRPQILVMDVDTGDVQVLSLDDNFDIQPEWSSDGSQLIFISTRNGPYQIWVMNADGSHQMRFSVSGDLKNTNPVISSDDRILIFTQSEGIGSIPHLRAVPFPNDPTGEYDVYPFSKGIPMRNADFSPDSFWITLESWPDGLQHDIYIMAPNGAEFSQLTTDPALEFDPAWRPINP